MKGGHPFVRGGEPYSHHPFFFLIFFLFRVDL